MLDIDERKITYKLMGGKHKLRSGKKIKTGETFKAYPSEVAWLGDRVMAMEPIPETKPVVQTISLMKKHKGFGKYDVINEKTGEAVNDKPLTNKEAELLISGKED